MSEIVSFEFKNYLDLSTEAKELVLSWRNNINVRKWMNHTEVISLEDHLKFIEGLKSSTTKKYFLAFYKKNPVGCVYLETKDERNFWGYFLDPELINTGMGTFLEFATLNLFFEQLNLEEVYAEVKADNVNTLSIQSYFGFKLLNENIYKLNRDEYSFRGLSFNQFKRELIKGNTK